MKKTWFGLFFVLVGFGSVEAGASGKGERGFHSSKANWVSMLTKGERLASAVSYHQRMRGTRLLLRSQKLAPSEFKTLIAASRASMLRGFASSDNAEMRRWGKRGWSYGRELIKRWPNRPEGYFWSAIHIGLIAKGSTPAAVLFQGLHLKMEKMAQTAIQRGPRVYRGIGHRILGRYYYRLPWPMRDVKKSLRYLRVAYRLDPHDAIGMLYYADTLWAVGQKSTAKKIYRRCAQRPLHHALSNPVQLPMQEAVRACRKKLQSL